MHLEHAILIAGGLTLGMSERALTQTVLTYDHLASCPSIATSKTRSPGCTKQWTIDIKPGDHFTVVIANTDISAFTHDIQGFAVAESHKPQTGPALASAPADTIDLEVTHDSRYGGYVVTIAPRIGGTTSAHLSPATLVIVAPQGKKPYSFSGGISLTNVRNPGFVVRREMDTISTAPLDVDTTNRIREDRDRLDAGTVGLATFATVNVPNARIRGKQVRLDWLNFALGIGLETNGETQYYFGAGAELHEGIFLNTGYVLGRVNMLPSGLRLGDVVTDANALANLSRRSTGGVFVGLSFTFLGGGQASYGKPLAGSQQ